jgi:hypothetical protein
MGVNWDSGVLFWKDHVANATERYTLSHLHPFQQRMELAAVGKHPARNVELYVAFGLHTFTRATEPDDRNYELYRDNRETRTFCQIRYRRSFELPRIIRTLETRRCEFARGFSGLMNYVTVETADGARYAAFFELRRLRTLSSNAVQLMVQSAYVLDCDKPAPGKGRIHFHALLGHVLRGSTPQRPP